MLCVFNSQEAPCRAQGGVLKIDNGVSFIEDATVISTGGSASSLDFSMNR